MKHILTVIAFAFAMFLGGCATKSTTTDSCCASGHSHGDACCATKAPAKKK
jgi:hypothetical protein